MHQHPSGSSFQQAAGSKANGSFLTDARLSPMALQAETRLEWLVRRHAAVLDTLSRPRVIESMGAEAAARLDHRVKRASAALADCHSLLRMAKEAAQHGATHGSGAVQPGSQHSPAQLAAEGRFVVSVHAAGKAVEAAEGLSVQPGVTGAAVNGLRFGSLA